MGETPTDNNPTDTARSRKRLWIWLLACLILFVLVVFASQTWILPGIIRDEAIRQLSAACGGPAQIRRVTVNLLGSATAKGIELTDRSGHTFLTTDSIRVRLGRWPSLRPTLARIDVGALKLILLVEDGRIQPPRLTSPDKAGDRSESNDQLELPNLSLTDGAIEIVEPNVGAIVLDGLSAEAIQQDGRMHVTFRRAAPTDPNYLSLDAVIDSNSLQSRIDLRARQNLSQLQMRLLLNALDPNNTATAAGELAVRMNLNGSFRRLEEMELQGTVELRNWTVTVPDVTYQISTDVAFDKSTITLNDLAVNEPNQPEWLAAGRIKAVFEDFLTPDTRLRDLEIDHLKLQAKMVNAKPVLPLPSSPDKPKDPNDPGIVLDKLHVQSAAFGIFDETGTQAAIDRISILATKNGPSYDLHVAQSDADGSERLALKGTVSFENSTLDLSLTGQTTLRDEEAGLLMIAIGHPDLAASGSLRPDVRFRGRLDDTDPVRPSGTLELADWSVTKGPDPLARDLNGRLRFGPDGTNIERLDLSLFEGDLNIQGQIDPAGRFGGRISADRIDLARWAAQLPEPDSPPFKGRLSLNLNLIRDTEEPNIVSGDGRVLLDDADLTLLPVLAHLFTYVGLYDPTPLTNSDLQATFDLDGPAVILRSAHIANTFAAVEAEPGGRVDFRNEKADFHAKVAMLTDLQELAKNGPTSEVAASLAKKATRLHVHGGWSDSPYDLVTSAPPIDLTETTLRFFRQVAEANGQFTPAMINEHSRR